MFYQVKRTPRMTTGVGAVLYYLSGACRGDGLLRLDRDSLRVCPQRGDAHGRAAGWVGRVIFRSKARVEEGGSPEGKVSDKAMLDEGEGRGEIQPLVQAGTAQPVTFEPSNSDLRRSKV